jgi:hypothetical protein
VRADNADYGHRSILSSYCSYGTGHRYGSILGVVQHGWLPDAGFDRTARLPPFAPVFVWNRRNLECLRDSRPSKARIVAIGSPFLYLDALMEKEPARQYSPPAQGTIVYPYHGMYDAEVAGDHSAYAHEIRDREEGAITICLYWSDYQREQIRRSYEALGLAVVCHGTRYDDAFLYRQYTTLRLHRRVIGNRVSSAIWYGGALGKSVEVYGDVFGTSIEESRAFDDEQQRRWPDLTRGGAHGGEAVKLARSELGYEYLRSPEELRQLFGWSGPRRALAATVVAAYRGTGALLRR